MTDKVQPTKNNSEISALTIGDVAGGIRDSYLAGRDITIHKGEEAYDVRGRPNPYLGLSPFTYDERGRYAGRERTVAEALTLLTTPGEQRTLLFVTGASGSGKSSFAQAGLLPALEIHYQQRNRTVRQAVFRPLRRPLDGLADAFLELGLPPEGPFAGIDTYMLGIPVESAPAKLVSLLVIDQFEELFTQAVSDQRDVLFAILESLPGFAELRMHIIATMRIDYLSDLFARKPLYDIAKQGIDLRAMEVDELKLAIQRPLQHAFPGTDKRFEAALLEKLAEDASGEAAYLPLLQVTLEDLWRRGILKRGAYGELTDAIQQRAEEIYAYTTDASGRTMPRSNAEQEMLLQIFLDLVEVSLDNKQHRDVRRRRPVQDVAEDSIERAKLIEELAANRLLSISLEAEHESGEEIEVVDIIHESLIVNWSRLQDAIDGQRAILQQRTRFEYALDEWLSQERDDAYLLDGVRLAEAETLDRAGDIALHSDDAQQLLRRSIDRRETRQRQELEQARRRALTFGVALVIALVALFATGWFFRQARQAAADEVAARQTAQAEVVQRSTAEAIAVTREAETQAAATAEAQQRQEAERQSKISLARQLAAQAISSVELRQDFELSLLLAVEAARTADDAKEHIQSVDDALRRALAVAPRYIHRHERRIINAVVFSPDGSRLGTASADGTVRLSDIASSEEVTVLVHEAEVWDVEFSPDGSRLTIASDELSYGSGTVRLFDTTSSEEVTVLAHEAEIRDVEFSPDGSLLVTASRDDTARLFNTASGEEVAVLVHQIGTLDVEFSSDSSLLAIGSEDGMARIFDTADGKEIAAFSRQHGSVRNVVFSPDGSRLAANSTATYGFTGIVRLFDTSNGEEVVSLAHQDGGVSNLLFSPDGSRLVTTSGQPSGENNKARLFDTASGEEVAVLIDNEGRVMDVEFSPDGSLLATGSEGGTARLFEAANGK